MGGFARRISLFVPALTTTISKKAGSAASDINRAIWREFLAAKIEVPFPQRDVRVSLQHADPRKRETSS